MPPLTRGYCFLLGLSFAVSPILAPKAAAANPVLAPTAISPDNLSRLDDLNFAGFNLAFPIDSNQARVVTLADIDRPGLAKLPGLNENERAIARSFDRIDERILRRGLQYLQPPLTQVVNYQRQFKATLAAQESLILQLLLKSNLSASKFPPLKFSPFPSNALDRINNFDAYQKAAYGRKDAGILADSFELVLPVSAALDSYSPEQLTVMPSMALAFANGQSLALEERLGQIRNAEPGVQSAGGKEAPAKASSWGTFVDGSGDFVDVGTTAEARGYGITQGTVKLGGYYNFSRSFTAGFTASYGVDDADLGNNNGRVKGDSVEGSLFASWTHGGFHLDGIAAGGYNSYDIRTHFGTEFNHGRIIPLSTTANTDGGFGDWLLGAGYDFHLGRLVFGPTVSLEYTHVSINSFSERAVDTQPAGFVSDISGVSHKDAAKLVNPVLKVMPQDVDSLRSTLGWAVSMPLDVGRMRLTPLVSVAWQHEYLDRQYGIDAAFPFAPGDPFTVHGPDLGSDSLLLQAGATLRITDRVSMYASYHGTFARQNYSEHAVQGGFRFSF